MRNSRSSASGHASDSATATAESIAMNDAASPAGESIEEILAYQARERPDAFFLRDTRRALTFNETQQHVGRLAAGLSRQGIGAGDRIALMLPNRIEFVLLWMACARLRVLCVFV